MAASSLTALNEDFLTCNICFEIYREPKILLCLHTFCRHCLEIHVGQGQFSTITCPLCREDSPLPKEGVCRLKNNFYIQNLIEFSESTSAQYKGRKCSFCTLMGKDYLAYSKCLTCRDFLCLECHSRHNFTTETINHETATLEDLQSGKHHEKLRSQQQIPCPDHTGEYVRYFCDTCNLSVCRDCVILSHRDHSILAPSDAIKKRRDEIGGLLQALEKKAMKFKEKSAKLRKQEKRIDAAEHDISQLIQGTVEKIVEKVQIEGKAAGDKVKSELKVRRDEIARIKHKHDEKSKLLDNAMEFCRKVIKDGLEGEIVFLQELMRNRLLSLESSAEEEEEENPTWSPPSIQISKMADSEVSLNLFRFESKLTFSNPNESEENDLTVDRDAEKSSRSAVNMLSKSFSPSRPNLSTETSNGDQKTSTTSGKMRTIKGEINLVLQHIISCYANKYLYDPKLTSIAWFDEDSFVVADEANGQVMHFSTTGNLVRSTAVKNVVTVACLDKVIYCGLRSGNVRMITKDLKVTDIGSVGRGYARPLVTLKNRKTLVAVGSKNLYLVENMSKNLRSRPIIDGEGYQTEINAKFADCFRNSEIIVSDWNSYVVCAIGLDGHMTNEYWRNDRGSYWTPGGLASDSMDNVFIADYLKSEVTILNSRFTYIDTIKLTNVTKPRCLSCSDKDQLLVAFGAGVALFQISHG